MTVQVCGWGEHTVKSTSFIIGEDPNCHNNYMYVNSAEMVLQKWLWVCIAPRLVVAAINNNIRLWIHSQDMHKNWRTRVAWMCWYSLQISTSFLWGSSMCIHACTSISDNGLTTKGWMKVDMQLAWYVIFKGMSS